MVKGVIKSKKMHLAAKKRMNAGGWLDSVNKAARELGEKSRQGARASGAYELKKGSALYKRAKELHYAGSGNGQQQ